MSLLTRLQNILEWQVPSMPLPTRQQTIFAVWLTFRCFFDSKSTRFSRPKHCYCQQVDKAFRCIGLVTVLPSGTLFVGKRFFLTDLCKPCWLKTENVHERKFFFLTRVQWNLISEPTLFRHYVFKKHFRQRICCWLWKFTQRERMLLTQRIYILFAVLKHNRNKKTSHLIFIEIKWEWATFREELGYVDVWVFCGLFTAGLTWLGS